MIQIGKYLILAMTARYCNIEAYSEACLQPLTSSQFSANAVKVMPWTETTISITQNDTSATIIDSANQHS